MTNTVCNAVTHTVADGVRRTVQNQNQNQTVLRLVCGVSGSDQIQSNGDLGACTDDPDTCPCTSCGDWRTAVDSLTASMRRRRLDLVR